MKNLNGKANVDKLGDTELLGWCKNGSLLPGCLL
jgi:hypothetical protein